MTRDSYTYFTPITKDAYSGHVSFFFLSLSHAHFVYRLKYSPRFCSMRHARTHATPVPMPGLVGDAGKPPRDMSAGINTQSRPHHTQPQFMRENVSSRPTDYLQDRFQFLFIYFATGIFSFYETIQ